MQDPFILQLLLAFASGSAVVTLATIAAEKLGSKAGGFIAGLPTTVAVTLLFIGLVQTPERAAEATDVVPLAVGFNGIFLVLYALLARHGLAWGICIGLAGWLALSSLVVLLDWRSFPAAMALYLFLAGGSYYILEKTLRLPAAGRTVISYTPGQLIWRALFSGGIVALAVYLSRVSGPLWGGILSPFPAVFVSTLIITAESRGVEFSRVLTKSMLVSGMVNVVFYATAIRYLYPFCGLGRGTFLSLVISGVSAYGTYLFIQRRMT